MHDLEGRVALVTGAGSGIGQATAFRLAEAGARIAALGRNAGDLERVAAMIRERGGDAMTLVADISDAGQMERAVVGLMARYGRLDIVFANAGVNGVWAPIRELDPEDWTSTISINLTGTFYTVKYALPHLERRGGSIVITSSVNGTRIFSNAGASAYASSKAGQVAFAKMAALELAKHRIRVNVICPGAISTGIDEKTERRDLEQAREPVKYPEGKVPLTDGRPGTPRQVADVVLFLASDASSHVTGTELWVDGAESLLVG